MWKQNGWNGRKSYKRFAQNCLTYSEGIYDIERYKQLRA
ncbi:NUDIX hydrolase N-terminal domain-containing protein [Nostoc sp. CCY 9925]